MRAQRRRGKRFVPAGSRPWTCQVIDPKRNIRIRGSFDDMSRDGLGTRLETGAPPWAVGDRLIVRSNLPATMAPLRVHATVRNIRFQTGPVLGLEIEPWSDSYDRLRDARLTRFFDGYAEEKQGEAPDLPQEQVVPPEVREKKRDNRTMLDQPTIAERIRRKSKKDLTAPPVY